LIEKSLIVIIFMYAASFSLLGVQYTLGDSFGITMVGADGTTVRSQVIDYIQIGNINAVQNLTRAEVQTAQDWIIYNPITAAAGIVWELFLLLTGTYVFSVMFNVLGIPWIWITGFVVLYFFLLMRTIVAYLRGI